MMSNPFANGAKGGKVIEIGGIAYEYSEAITNTASKLGVIHTVGGLKVKETNRRWPACAGL